MKVIVEVKQAQGEVKQGISNRTQKPYKMAEQEVAVYVAGSDFPVVGRRDIYVPKLPNGDFGDPEWMKPGRYEVTVRVHTDRFGRIECSLDFRHAKSVAVAPQQKAA